MGRGSEGAELGVPRSGMNESGPPQPRRREQRELHGARPSGTLPSTRPGPLKPSIALRRPPSPSRARQAPHPFASRTCSGPRALRCSSGAASCAPRPGPFKSRRATWSRPLHAPKETCHPGTRYGAPEGPKALWHQGACAARLAAGGGTEGRRGLDPGAGRPAADCAGSPRTARHPRVLPRREPQAEGSTSPAPRSLQPSCTRRAVLSSRPRRK